MTLSTAPSSRPHSRAWLWAVATIATVAIVVAGAYAGHRYVARAQLAAAHVPPPATPPAAIESVVRPEAGAAFVAPAGTPGQLVLLVGPRERSCPPVGACEAAPPLDALLVVDTATGATRVRAALAGDAQHPVALAVDPRRGLAAVVSASGVEVFATATGARTGDFALPAGVVCGPETGAAISDAGILVITAQQAGHPVLLGLDERSGASRFTTPLADAATVDGPLYLPSLGEVATLAGRADGATLAAFSATDGAARDTVALPAGTRLGPLDGDGQTLYVFGADGTTSRLPLAALAGSSAGAGSPLTAVSALQGVTALGWDTRLGHIYLADAEGLRILDAASGATLAALPLPAVWAPDAPLPTEPARDLVYVPMEHGAVAVVQDGPNPAAHALTPDTAAALARAAVARLVAQGPQDPPFLAPDTFTVGPGTRDAALWADDATLGWQNASPATARLAVAPATSAGAYDVSFTVTWTLRFEHTRSWVYHVAPDGGVQVVSEQGDVLP